MRKLNAAGIDLIKRAEGCRLQAYLCPAGVPTVGWGHTEGVELGQTVTQHQADVMLAYDLDLFAEGVEKRLKGVVVTDNQFAAMVSLAFNVGITRFANSTLLRYVLGGKPASAADEFRKWRLVGGHVDPGIVKRREIERTLFLKA